ncbi:MAG: hypothetical protein WKF71_13745 [Pyrinomonadaceae bacterium]
MTTKILDRVFYFVICILVSPSIFYAQAGEIFNLTAESLQDDKQVALDKTVWKYRAGDDPIWAARDFDDRDWETIEGTIVKSGTSRPSRIGTDARGFVCASMSTKSLADKNVAFILHAARRVGSLSRRTTAGEIRRNYRHGRNRL